MSQIYNADEACGSLISLRSRKLIKLHSLSVSVFVLKLNEIMFKLIFSRDETTHKK